MHGPMGNSPLTLLENVNTNNITKQRYLFSSFFAPHRLSDYFKKHKTNSFVFLSRVHLSRSRERDDGQKMSF